MSRVVLVTGASSGLGKATADHLAELGYIVYGTCRNPSKYEAPLDYQLVRLNLNEPSSIQKCIEAVLSKQHRIDILINNAGLGIIGSMEELDVAALRSNFETNCYGPLQLIQAVLPQMRKQQNGFIINI